MTKIWLVFKHEVTTLVRKPAYLILSFGIPLIAIVVLVGYNLAKSDSPVPTDEDRGAAGIQAEGYVDLAGVMQVIPDELPNHALRRYSSVADAERALSDEDISAYYIIPAGFIQTGELVYIHPTLNPLASDRQDWIILSAVQFNLIGADPELSAAVRSPLNLREIDLSAAEAGLEGDCSRPGVDCDESVLVRMMPLIVIVFFFVILTNGSGLIMRSVAGEKQNRLIEILATSIDHKSSWLGRSLDWGS